MTVARVITDEEMMSSVMAVTRPDDEERRSRLMQVLSGILVAP